MRVAIRSSAYPLHSVPFLVRVLPRAADSSPGSHSAQASVRLSPAVGFAGPSISLKKHFTFTTNPVNNA